MQEPMLYSKKQTLMLLGGISMRLLDLFLYRGEITPTRLGDRVFFSRKEIESFVERRSIAKQKRT